MSSKNTTNCNTLFHKFWITIDIDLFLPLSFLSLILLSVFFAWSFNTHTIVYSQTAQLLDFKTETVQQKNSQDYIQYKFKYQVGKIIYTRTVPKNCSNADVRGNTDNPQKVKIGKLYHDYVSLFGLFETSSKVEYETIYQLE